MRHPRLQPSWPPPSHRTPSSVTTSFFAKRRFDSIGGSTSTQVFSTRRWTRNVLPHKASISGIKGWLSRVPLESSVARISCGERTTTRSPAKNLSRPIMPFPLFTASTSYFLKDNHDPVQCLCAELAGQSLYWLIRHTHHRADDSEIDRAHNALRLVPSPIALAEIVAEI